MRALVDEHQLAGVTTLVARHGKVVHLDAYGVQDLESKKPVTKDTIFRTASMTKPLAGVAMMMLWEEGSGRSMIRWRGTFPNLPGDRGSPQVRAAVEKAGLRGARGSAEVGQKQ